MPSSAGNISSGIPVRVYLKDDTIKQGVLFYREEGPILEIGSNDVLESSDSSCFSFVDDVGRIGSDTRILLSPIAVVELDYSPDRTSRFHMYPPSSNRWLTHVVEPGCKSIFTVHIIPGKQKRLLTIVDKETMNIFYAGLIQPYESSILEMKRDWTVHDEIIFSEVDEARIFEILSRPSLSWPSLSKLVEGVPIPNLELKKTMEETLDQLVPKSFPQNIRKQILAFLAWLEDAKVPKEDPTDFIMRLSSVSAYRILVRGHLQCILDNVRPPSYVKLIQLVDTGQIELTQRPPSESDELDSWTLLRFKLHEIFPDWTGRVVEYAKTLQSQNKVITELPVSRLDAKNSEKAWSDRFAMDSHGLFFRGHIFKKSLGLVPAIYIGGAHRWPHRHLEWSARLGFDLDRQRHLQIMVMPKSGFERVVRLLPKISLIDWEMSAFNLNLYDAAKRKWKLKRPLILRAFEQKRSLKQLSNEFGDWKGSRYLQLSSVQAKILDLVSWALYLSSLEKRRYSRYYGISNSQIEHELEDMHTQGIFKLQYFLIPERLRSLCHILSGPSAIVCSVSRAFLKYTPSAQVRISDKGSSSIIVSRVPDDEYPSLSASLNEATKDTELNIRTYPISAYTGYRNNLYSRLLKDDGFWDEDVSGLLNQVRLPSQDDKD